MEGNVFIRTPNIKITRFYVDSNESSEQVFKNLIVTNGLNIMRNHLLSTLSTTALWPSVFMLGSGSTPAYSTDTSLQSSSVSVSFSGSTQRTAGVTFEASVGTTIGWGSTWKEIGVFTSSSELIGRSIITIPITKTSSSLTVENIEWAFDFSI